MRKNLSCVIYVTRFIDQRIDLRKKSMELVGYIAAVLIGVSLGLIGGGGSILTVPVLVYLFGVDPVLATAYSLFIVGSTALVGVISKIRNLEVDFKAALTFGIPSVIAVFITRKYIIPFIPDIIISNDHIVLSKGTFLLILFSILMLLAAYSMYFEKTNTDQKSPKPKNLLMAMIEGALVGVLTGLVGAGGGFLIIPALVLLGGLPMKKAIGTSLLIIATKSLIGFIGDVSNYYMDWKLLISVSILAIIGIFIGNGLSKLVSGAKLKKGFSVFVIIMGLYIIIKEIFIQN